MKTPPENKLRDSIRTLNGDMSAINIVQLGNGYYISESSLLNFESEYDIKCRDVEISNICEFYNISNVNILNEVSQKKSDDLMFLYEMMSLTEALDAKAVMKTAKGPSILEEYINRAVAFILKRQYDSVGEIDNQIKQCDRMIEDIDDELDLIMKDPKKSSSYKFSMMYIYRIATKVFKQLVVPFAKAKGLIIPQKLNMFSNLQNTMSSVDKLSKIKDIADSTGGRIAKDALIAGNVVSNSKSDVSNLYLSFNNYQKLLNLYRKDIMKVKNDLESKKKRVIQKEKKNAK